jgi:hypothetical protein
MDLYCFRPSGHGETSAYVMAESLEDAKRIVLAESERQHAICVWFPILTGFDTDYYTVEVIGSGIVAWNDND